MEWYRFSGAPCANGHTHDTVGYDGRRSRNERDA
jgi:hypothetical protein